MEKGEYYSSLYRKKGGPGAQPPEKIVCLFLLRGHHFCVSQRVFEPFGVRLGAKISGASRARQNNHFQLARLSGIRRGWVSGKVGVDTKSGAEKILCPRA